MYTLLLCWRYLRTRYLAFVCVVSVMLGVATLIVVNSVMSGFSTKLRDRLHGLLSDVTVESVDDLGGFPDPFGKMDRIRRSAIGRYVAAMSPTVETGAFLQYPIHGVMMTRQVKLVGVDVATRAQVGGFAEYLVDKDGNRLPPSFAITDEAKQRYQSRLPPVPDNPTPLPDNTPLDAPPPPAPWVVPAQEPCGVILGACVVGFRPKPRPGEPEGEQPPFVYMVQPGDGVTLTTVSGAKLAPAFDQFVAVGYFKSEMSEYDANTVFVPLDYLQRLRAMDDRVTSIQIKLTDPNKSGEVVDALNRMFPGGMFRVQTWEKKQAPILAAIAIERGILNVLLFLIVGVAGFGILAIFSMIVVEKTRDIGVLKALGASRGGILAIFLGFGLLLGLTGAALGTGLGLLLTHYLNEVEALLSYVSGQQVFPRDVYYFDRIPTNVEPIMLALVNAGSIAIAVLFSLFPAARAAALHPVRALRFE